MTKKPHVHAETIRAWADGESIQYRVAGGDRWVDCADPAWVADYVYRVKPAREYPTTLMTRQDFKEATGYVVIDLGPCTDIANAALRHAIDASQVVPIGEVSALARNLAQQMVDNA